MRMRAALSALLICASLAACARGGDEPRPTGTLEPRITESSALPTNSPDNKACKLLSADEREALPGFSMNDRVPVEAQAGTEECIWVHSRRTLARAAIRLIAFNAQRWAPQAASQVNRAMRDPRVTPTVEKKLKKALAELTLRGNRLPPERICDIYMLSLEARGFHRTSDLVSFDRIGSMPAAYALSCEHGVLILGAYGEYGMQPSIALQHGVVRLVEAANERAPEVFGGAGAGTGYSSARSSNGSDTSEPSPTPTEAETSSDRGATH